MVGQQGKFLTFQMTTAATVPLGVPNQVDRTFPHVLSVRNLHRILHNVDFHPRTERNQFSHFVILEADDSVAVTLGSRRLGSPGGKAANTWGLSPSRLVLWLLKLASKSS